MDKVTAAGAKVRTLKEKKEDITEALAELKAAKVGERLNH